MAKLNENDNCNQFATILAIFPEITVFLIKSSSKKKKKKNSSKEIVDIRLIVTLVALNQLGTSKSH